jgi:hypothetical protein
MQQAQESLLLPLCAQQLLQAQHSEGAISKTNGEGASVPQKPLACSFFASAAPINASV